MLEFITLIIIRQSQLNLGIIILEFKINQKIPSILIDPILQPKNIFTKSFIQSLICFLQINYIIIGTFASNPIVELYFYIGNVTVEDLVKVMENRKIVIVV